LSAHRILHTWTTSASRRSRSLVLAFFDIGGGVLGTLT
jgi:hypothetical protein